MNAGPIKVILVDDSPVVLAVLKKMLAESPDVAVVATAADGREALATIQRVKPDVVLTDLEMPEMDGLELTRAVMETHPLPIMVVSAQVRDRESQKVFELLRAGAIEIFPKPEDGMSPNNAALRKELIRKIKILSGIVVFHRHAPEARTPAAPAAPERSGRFRILAFGSSTGGPQALLKILPALGKDFPLPVACVQHISTGFLGGLVDWIQDYCALDVRVAEAGEKALPGRVYFPAEGRHLTCEPDGTFRYSEADPVHGHRPAVDVLFQSLARNHGEHAIGVILTGMGEDGAKGLAEIRSRGGTTIAQDEKTSTVFGMPARAVELGGAEKVLGLEEIAPEILRIAAGN